MIRKIVERILGSKRREAKPRDFEWERFQRNAREQFERLRDKGLSIPVVTL
ncbi:hypothetical protein HZB96_03930 [Candidatus Gottesmanbacteria bacterium]|nr:hypothetical protein [Candidatus Gottesmanbacteria bacterium]